MTNSKTQPLAKSIERFGFVEPMVVDERTGRLVAGHGRLESLMAAKARGEAPPDGVLSADQDWSVPVVRGWASRSDVDAEAYIVASNRLTEVGGWDDGELDKLLVSIAQDGGADALQGTGYDRDDVDRILRDLQPQAEDPIPEPSSNPWVKSGDLFRIGDHRILCGDSTKTEDVRRLMAGERAGLMNTDPPYGVSYNPAELRDNGRASAIANDDLRDVALQAFLESVFRSAKADALLENAAWYLWHAQLTQGYFAAAAAAANVVIHRQIIWVKPSLILGRGQYHWRHEPCFMGWVQGHQPPDYGEGNGERTQTTVWELDGVPVDERKKLGHSTPKPVRLFEIPIVKHLQRGEICFEPFSGSGPQIIAAEKTGRRCFAMELEPRFVQVALERWEAMTGRKAEKLP